MSNREPYALAADLWRQLKLPSSALLALTIQTPETPILPSSFRIDTLSSISIGLVSLAASYYASKVTESPIKGVTIPQPQATLAFKSERLYTIDGIQPEFPAYFGGLHRCRSGFIRVHDAFAAHRQRICGILGLSENSGKAEVSKALELWSADDFEKASFDAGAVAVKLRNYEEWDKLMEARELNHSQGPVSVALSTDNLPEQQLPPSRQLDGPTKCLQGVKVIELSRVVAGPVAGRALAAHGADVTWVIGPKGKTEDLPVLDKELSRGKRRLCLDLDTEEGAGRLKELIKHADVFIQAYRPGSLEERGLGIKDIQVINPKCTYACLSAWGTGNAWSHRRGFDSIVQTASGMNHSEAKLLHPDENVAGKAMPCQALDHATGYFLAASIISALCLRYENGQTYLAEVSLEKTAQYLRSLGQFKDKEAWASPDDTDSQEQVLQKYGEISSSWFKEVDTEWGKMRYLKYPAHIDGREVGIE